MGQYFKGIALGEGREIKRIFDYGSKFATIGEQSPLINNIYNYLRKNPSRFVWIGDYVAAVFFQEL